MKKLVFIFTIAIFFCFINQQIWAEDTGWLRATSYTNNGVFAPNNALRPYLEDHQTASFDQTNVYIDFKDFSISIPEGKRITGIEVQLNGSANPNNLSVELSWNNGSDFTTTSYHSDFTTYYNRSTEYFGGPVDFWGKNNWTATELSNGNFLVRLAVVEGSGPGSTELDFIAVKVYYQSTTSPITFLSNGTFVVPEGVTQVNVQAWGAGGKGGGNFSPPVACGGGGGGAYASSTLTVTPGTAYTVQVGRGDDIYILGLTNSWFGSTSMLFAKGGYHGSNGPAGDGGSAAECIGDIIYGGGNGASGYKDYDNDDNILLMYSGGGGSSAGTANAGNSTSSYLGAIAPADGGNGGNGVQWTGSNSGPGNAGAFPGGGGGGAISNSGDFSGGNGGGGQVIVSWVENCTKGTIALKSGTDNQTICAGTAITPIVYTIGGGATGATVSPNLPTGLSGVYDANTKTFTISGTPEVYGNFSYTVETTGSSPCTEATATGTIIVKVQPVATAPVIGNGTSGNPYQIATLENLYWIRANPSSWTKYFIQTQDIDASTTSDWCTGGWLPIGIAWENSETEIKVFSGSYDGQGHTISGLHITKSITVAYGLFGMTRGAAFKNLGITNVEISGVSDHVGALVGYASGVSIYNCYNTGNISGLSYVGGLVGSIVTSSKMENCYSSCNVNGVNYVGGLAGSNGTSEIIYCFSSNVTVTGNGYCIGGLAGSNISGASISKCYCTGTVSGPNSVGGLVGMNTINASIANCFSRANILSGTQANNNGGLVGWNDRAYIYNSYSTGAVGQYMGGLVGTNSGYEVSNSFWDKQTSGVDHSSGGTGKTTAEMKDQSTFTDWDFSIIWGISADNNDGYPYFKCTNATLAISSGSNNAGVCVNTAITPIVYNVGGGASGATISPTLPNGLSGTYDSGGKTFTISGTPTVTGTYEYTITTTGTPLLCSEATATGTITVNPLPEVSSINNNSPICYDTDAYFYLKGTPGAEVVYSFDGGTTTRTVSLTGGTAMVLDMEARSDVTLSLISIKNISTGCTKALTSTSIVSVNSPTVSISGDHIACTSTTLTAVTNASSPTYYWGTINDEGLISLVGEGPSLVVTETGNYILMVKDGITGCEVQSEAFAVTFIPEPEVSIINNNSPTCYDDNAIFYLAGTPGAEVVYSFDGGITTWTVSLIGGTATVEAMEARSEVTLSLISIKIISTGCNVALHSTSTVTVNSPTVSISGEHIACSSTTLTAITNASSPTYFWATINDEGWVSEGEGPTFEVTQSGNYYVAVLDGITGCDRFSDAFEVTINPAPEVQVTPTSYNITEGGSVTLTATGTADTYTWSPSAGLNITTGATVVAKPVKNTTYTVTGFIGGCSNTASAVITVQELCKNSADQYEPNNSMLDNLFSIPIDLTISANLLNSKDPDWYRLEITDLAKYTLKLTKIGTVNPAVDLYGSNGRRLKSIDRTQPFSYNLAPDTYYIKLSAGVKTYLCYTLQVVNDGSSVGAIASFDDTKSAKIIEPVPDGIFRIWPNPSKNEFKLYNGNENQVRVRVVDVIGRTIETIENVGISETVAFGNKYKPGIYFIEAFGNGVQKVFKIVKQ